MASGTKRRTCSPPAPPDAGAGVLIGYARVSTEDQKLDLQRDALAQLGCHRVFEDRASGARAGSDVLSLRQADEEPWSVPFTGRLTLDHGLAAREALVAGSSPPISGSSTTLLTLGAVRQVLPDIGLEPVPLSILFVPARARIARERLVIDALAAFLRLLPGVHD